MNLKFYIFIFSCFLLFNCSVEKVVKTTVQYKQAENVKPEKNSLDIYNNEPGKEKPVVVFVHGGAWFLGDKATKIKKKVALFKKQGYVFVSVNYRLSSFFNKKVQYPAHTQDVADAVKWVYDNIEKYGGDKNKIALIGHSAGAQMISLLATSAEFLPLRGIEFNKIRGIISIDTEGYDVYGMGRAGVKIYKRIFGNDPETWKRASPVLHIKPGTKYPDFLIVMRGKPYRIKMANDFADKLRGSGAKAALVSGEPYGHFKVNNIIGSAKDKIVTPKLVEFLEKVFE